MFLLRLLRPLYRRILILLQQHPFIKILMLFINVNSSLSFCKLRCIPLLVETRYVAHTAGMITPFWILDSDTSMHIYCTRSLFETLVTILPVIVRLPDKSKFELKFSDSIRFSDDSYLDGVLYIPQF